MPSTASGANAFDEKGREACRWRCVSRGRLADDLIFWNAIELSADGARKKIVGDDPEILRLRQRRESVNGALDHGSFAVERQYLFGSGLAAARPEPGSTATGEDDRPEINFQNGRPLFPSSTLRGVEFG